jgi:hypothetical protein
MEILISVSISIFIGILLMELYAWLDPLAKWLVERVAKTLPHDRQADFKEQFIADLATLPNSIAKVYFALRDCTLAAQSIYQAVYREGCLSLVDDLDDMVEALNRANRLLEATGIDFESAEFISVVDQSLTSLRRHQQQDDCEAQVAIDHFQTLSSPVVHAFSAIQAHFERRHERFVSFFERLREPLARATEISEKVRRRMLDEKPLSDDDMPQLSSLSERSREFTATLLEYNAQKEHSPGDFSDVPAFPVDVSAQLEKIVEAFQAAARVVKRPK